MRRPIRLILCAALLLTLALLAGCEGPGAGAGDGGKEKEKDAQSLQVVTTIFPVYDWTRSVLGDEEADVTMLLKSGVDLHSFQPSAADIQTMSSCDVFIYVGGESDDWVEDALKESVNEDMVAVDLMEALGSGVKEEESVEGMEAGRDEEEGETEYDEHIWLSLRNAETCVDAITGALCEADPGNEGSYRANAEAYKERLAALDGAYEDAVAKAGTKTLLFGDRFPFRYMTDDYGLEYFAAFKGCSAETEASFETIRFLAGKLDELSLPAVVTIEGSDGKIAETIVKAGGDEDLAILKLDSMQSVTSKDIEAGTTYIDIMEKNLEVLKQALGEEN